MSAINEKDVLNIELPSAVISLKTFDLHACGEPARVVVGGMPVIDGETMADKRLSLMNRHDYIRKLLLQEPRGYPCQNANIIFPSTIPGVQFGFVILEQNKIYPMMSGHNTICVATALLTSQMIPMPAGTEKEAIVEFDLEAPAGRVPVRAKCIGGKVKSVTLRNVPSFVALKGVSVTVPEIGDVVVDVVYSGMWYCVVKTSDVPSIVNQRDSLLLRPNNGRTLCRVGEMIKTACREQYPVNHPHMDYPGCDILVFRGGIDEVTAQGSHAKNTVVMSNGKLVWGQPNTYGGMLDRSPCGTGTGAVMTCLHYEGELSLHTPFVHESIIGTQFVGELVGECEVGLHRAVVSEITGSAWVTQICTVVLDPDDPFQEGFTVGDIWS